MGCDPLRVVNARYKQLSGSFVREIFVKKARRKVSRDFKVLTSTFFELLEVHGKFCGRLSLL